MKKLLLGLFFFFLFTFNVNAQSFSYEMTDGRLVFTEVSCPLDILAIAKNDGASEADLAQLKSGIAQHKDKNKNSIRFCYKPVEKDNYIIVTEFGAVFLIKAALRI